jgi:hypothetical protein
MSFLSERANEDDVGPGWREIVLELAAKIDAKWDHVHALQIKEKFGGLRVYWCIDGELYDVDECSIAVSALVKEAEKKAWKTCEACGKPGELRRGGWMKTLCDEHAALRNDRLV